MPLTLETEPAELEPGQYVYEVLADVVSELEPDELMALVGAVQRGDPWPRLPKQTREILEDLDSRLFDEVEEG